MDARKLLLVAGLVVVAWLAAKHGFLSTSANLSESKLRQLASKAGSQEVLIYTTTDCPYCAEAKAWMRQYGFTFTECDAQVREDCARELQELGSGVPYLIVRGHHMKDGFDSNEFIAALQDGAE